MTNPHRSIQHIVEEQAKKWAMRSREKKETKPDRSRVVAISNQFGSAGSVVAKMVADDLGYDLFDREITHKTAESAQISEKLIESLDDKEHKLMEDWISAFFTGRHVWPDEYLRHLLKVMLTISRHGRAVVVGRGAAYLLPPESALRVRILAAFDERVKYIAKELKMTIEEAESQVKKFDKERSKFAKQYFLVDIDDPNNFDLLLNTGRIGVRGAAEAIKSALKHFGSNV